MILSTSDLSNCPPSTASNRSDLGQNSNESGSIYGLQRLTLMIGYILDHDGSMRMSFVGLEFTLLARYLLDLERANPFIRQFLAEPWVGYLFRRNQYPLVYVVLGYLTPSGLRQGYYPLPRRFDCRPCYPVCFGVSVRF